MKSTEVLSSLPIANDEGKLSKQQLDPHQFVSHSSRIPKSLQSVFLQSNQGNEVHVPPSEKIASKVFESKNTYKRHHFGGTSKKTTTILHSPVRACRNLLSITASHLHLKLKTNTNSNNTKANTKKSNSNVQTTKKKRKKKKPLNTSESNDSDGKPPKTSRYSSPGKKMKSNCPTLSPQDYLDAMIRSRGYSTTRYKALETGYYNQPTPLQIASYGITIEKAVRAGDASFIAECMKCGLSCNPSNKDGTTIVHTACRLNDPIMLQTLVQTGCDVKIADTMGRTPLHEACWTHEPNFQLIEMILQLDIQLLYISDQRNFVPLQYAPRESWAAWLQFLASKNDMFWPKIHPLQPGMPIKTTKKESNTTKNEPKDKWNNEDSVESTCINYPTSPPPPLVLMKPNTRPIQDPTNALSTKMASMVSSGKIEPSEVMFFMECYEDEDSFSSDDYDEDDDESFSTSGDDNDEDLTSSSTTQYDDEDDLIVANVPDSIPSSYKKVNDERETLSMSLHRVVSNTSLSCKSDHTSESDNSFWEKEMLDLLELVSSKQRRFVKLVDWCKSPQNGRHRRYDNGDETNKQ